MRVEPDDPEVAADARHGAERTEAVPRKYEREGASIAGVRDVAGHLSGGLEQGGDLVRLRLESYTLDLDLVTVEPHGVDDAGVEEPVRPCAHAKRHVAKVIGNCEDCDVQVSL